MFHLSRSVAPKASQLQGLTVMQQRDYEITFKNVDEFKKATGEVWISLEENIIDRNTHVGPK